MPHVFRRLQRSPFFSLLIVFLGLMGCSATRAKPKAPSLAAPTMPQIRLEDAPSTPVATLTPGGNGRPASAYSGPVMLGIDVLEEQGFAILKGKRVGLLTHVAGVNRRGEQTVDVLRRAPGIRLVALYGVEHGIRGDLPAEYPYKDQVDARTGLMIYSLYNGSKERTASPAQLKGIDVLVIDLQDIGTRSYTYISAMHHALEACFKEGKEVVVLDRPNPLGGLKVDGPSLDAQWMSYVGAFRIPYVHGLTIGELARMSKEAPGVLNIPDSVRERGRLTVVPMKGWRRSMRWPDTGLRWVPTSPMIKDYAAVLGYPMAGLGCYLGGFRHGVGDQYPFRGISHKTVPTEVVERELKALRLPGLRFRVVSVDNKQGKPATGVFVEITDFDEWNPTELSFHLMRLACKLEKTNPFVTAANGQANGFLRHMGSTAFFDALRRDGARVDVGTYFRDWKARCQIYQVQTKRYWLYQ